MLTSLSCEFYVVDCVFGTSRRFSRQNDRHLTHRRRQNEFRHLAYLGSYKRYANNTCTRTRQQHCWLCFRYQSKVFYTRIKLWSSLVNEEQSWAQLQWLLTLISWSGPGYYSRPNLLHHNEWLRLSHADEWSLNTTMKNSFNHRMLVAERNFGRCQLTRIYLKYCEL